MKKLFCMLLVAEMVVFAGSVTASAIDLQVGVETEFGLGKTVELENLGVDANYTAQYFDVTLETNIADWLTITPKVGINRFNAEIASPIGEIGLNSGTGWNIGLDVKADVYSLNIDEVNYADFSLIGGYRFSRTDIDEIDIAGITINNPIESIVYMHEWEIGGMVSRNLKDILGGKIDITPYVGIVYSDLRGNADINLSIINLDEEIKAASNFGLRFGLNAEPIDDLLISLNGKLVDETAIIASVSYRF